MGQKRNTVSRTGPAFKMRRVQKKMGCENPSVSGSNPRLPWTGKSYTILESNRLKTKNFFYLWASAVPTHFGGFSPSDQQKSPLVLQDQKGHGARVAEAGRKDNVGHGDNLGTDGDGPLKGSPHLGQNQAESLALKTVRSWRPKKKLKLKPLIAVATSQQNQIQRQGTQRWSKVANAFGHLANSTTTSAARLKRDVKTLRCLASLWAWQSLFLVTKNWWSWLDPKKCLVNVTIPINGLITISQCGNNKATGWLAALVRVTNLKLSFSRRRDKMLVLCAACQQQPCFDHGTHQSYQYIIDDFENCHFKSMISWPKKKIPPALFFIWV